MRLMFFNCYKFNQQLNNWDVSNVTDMSFMFYYCKSFNQPLTNWDVSNVNNYYAMFEFCPIEEKYKPKFI